MRRYAVVDQGPHAGRRAATVLDDLDIDDWFREPEAEDVGAPPPPPPAPNPPSGPGENPSPPKKTAGKPKPPPPADDPSA